MRRGAIISALGRWPWLIAGLAYSLLASLTINYTRLDDGVALVWVANGFLIPWLALHRAREWPPAIAVCLAGNLAATVQFGAGWGGLALPALNLLESIVTVLILRRWIGNGQFLESTSGIAKFALVATLAPAAAAPLAALIAHQTLGVAFDQTAFNWFVGHSLGVIMMAPLASLALRAIHNHDGIRWRRDRAVALATWLAPVVAVTLIVFAQDSLPLFFLPLVPMTLATLRLGRLGVGWSAVILAVIASVATARHHGPVAAMAGSPVAQIQFLQFYLAATVFTLVPIAVLMRQLRSLMERLSTSESALRLMAENSGDAMLHTDTAGRIIQATGALEALLERDADWLLGRFAADLVAREDRDALVATHLDLLADPGRTVDFEYRVRMRDGSDRWFESRARALIDADGRPVGTISAIRNIDARKRTQSELELAATTDQLTGLLNRRAFYSYFELTSGGGKGGILIIADLDHFKSVNDRFGHHAGDAVLQGFARVAQAVLRQTDVVARIGGEEFAFYLPGAKLDEGYALCERLRRALLDAGFDGGKAGRYTVTASMGMVAIDPLETPAAALKRADAALYAAKEAGRDCLRLAA